MWPPETVSDGGLSDSPEKLWKPAVIGWGITAGCHLAGEYPRKSDAESVNTRGDGWGTRTPGLGCL